MSAVILSESGRVIMMMICRPYGHGYTCPPVELRSSDDESRGPAKPVKTAWCPRICCPWHPWLRGLVPLAAAPAVNGFCCHPIAKRGTHAVGAYTTHSKKGGQGPGG